MLKKIVILSWVLNIAACSVFSTQPPVPNTGPQAASANVQLGLAYLQSGDMQRAKQKLLLAEQQAPTLTKSQGAMGYFLESTGNFSQAEVHYRRAVTLNPKSGAAQNNYATFLCRRGRYEEAEQHFSAALQDPNYLGVAQVHENAGLCAMRVPNVSRATVHFIQAIVYDPKRAVAFLGLGQIEYQHKNYLQAQRYLDQYMKLANDPTPNALWLGAALARALNNEADAGRYTLMLQTRFPNSDAYKALIKMPKLNNTQQKKQLYY